MTFVTEYFAFTHASFFFNLGDSMFLRLSQTLSPILNSGAGFLFLLDCSSIACWDEAIAAAAYSWASTILSMNLLARFVADELFLGVNGSLVWIGSAW